MMSNPLKDLITRDDIANVAENEGLILDDNDRISVLETMRSIDIQACPGSGKTTLIATKLILLSIKWPLQHQGVCVLSHTNVAKDEIISRLKNSKTTEAQRLLSYPHFIGTIQEFVNRFLALPYIRSNGISDITVDNDEYTKVAENILNLGRFAWLRGTLNGLGDHNAQAAFLRATYRTVSQGVEEINIDKKPRAWRQDANLQRAVRDIQALKNCLEGKGYYLYRDMYTYAQKLCSQNAELRKSLSKRFPYVFLDEMQDTQKFQDELLSDIFSCNTPLQIVQRFGDPDQAIFHNIGNEEANESFNGKSRDDMDFVINKSHRFDGLLADKIKYLSLKEVPLESELTEECLADRAMSHAEGVSFEHTIIVFDDATRSNVIKKYSEIVSTQFAGHRKSSNELLVKVVGAVGNDIDPNANQLKIGHYWSDYDKNKIKSNFKASSLIEAVRYCRQISSIDLSEKYSYLVNCILFLMRISGMTDANGRYFSSSTLKNELKESGEWKNYRETIFLMLNDDNKIDQQFWNDISRLLVIILKLDDIPDEASEYMRFIEDAASLDVEIEEGGHEDDAVISMPGNKVKHSDGFQLELSTIHGVKGETHDATLIVETKNHTFDLETMLPYLTGELPSDDHQNQQLPDKPNSRRNFKPNKTFMKQLYVAMSRPKHLLCLALHTERISEEDKQSLQVKGWQIETLI
ncbi:MAG: UvrD-helicase domain-containing protein [Gammaproteobacteria bacterium]|nr:UvrD-helicase domain-containing protein [Gammaproteobacteria bacterium]